MKKVVIIFFILALIVGKTFAADGVDNQKIGNSKNAKNIVKLNLGAPNGIAYERAIADKMSLQIQPYFNFNYLESGIDTMTLGGSITPRFYLSATKNNLSGWFIGVPISGGIMMDNDSNSGIVVAASVGGGYQWVFPSGFSIDLFGAGGLGYGIVSDDSDDEALGGLLTDVHASVGLGYAF